MMKTCFPCRRGIVALVLVLSLCLIVPMSPRSYAINVDQPAQEEIESRYTGTSLITASLSIPSSGEAECWGAVSCYPGYSAYTVMRLQWKNANGVWIDWDYWKDEGNMVDYYETSQIPHGRTYRVRVVADVWDADGNWVETVSAISGSEYY